jgi:hypothetical protein
MQKLLLKPEEVADALSISTAQVYKLIKAKTLSSVVIPDMNQTRVRVDELIAFVKNLSRKCVEQLEAEA